MNWIITESVITAAPRIRGIPGCREGAVAIGEVGNRRKRTKITANSAIPDQPGMSCITGRGIQIAVVICIEGLGEDGTHIDRFSVGVDLMVARRPVRRTERN